MFTRGTRPPGRCPPAVRAAGAQPSRRPDVRRRDVGCDARLPRSIGCRAAGGAGSARAWLPPPASTGSPEAGTDLSNSPSRRWPRCSPSCSSSSPGARATTRSARPIRSAPRLAWIIGLVGAFAPRRRHRARVPVGRRAPDRRRSAAYRQMARVPHATARPDPGSGECGRPARAAAGLGRRVRDGCRRARRRAVVGGRRGRPPGVERRRRNAAHRACALPDPTGLRPPTDRRHGHRRGRAHGVAGRGREMLGRVADGQLLESLVDRFPEHDDLVENVAEILATLMFIPMAWSIWAIVAGVVDTVSVTERVGVVVRARRPGRRHPIRQRPAAARRPRPLLGVPRRRRRDAARASPRGWPTSARQHPQGAQARVRATPLLGHVRKSEPIGTATRRDQPLSR